MPIVAALAAAATLAGSCMAEARGAGKERREVNRASEADGGRRAAVPPIDRDAPARTATATFALG